ncbi:FAD-dependent oxidoreductase [Albimonas sp. CAU 1670]|uniref:NAD(P)/FAD-dependent oxidoreductase n=1 Tax=Albimonas sp. CAU 1670 TaxID=3032599 RepID=UPI0023DC2B31|nr:FAD-dependent oxidoreductase [Albimonas sp. CAU 1670]MDF2235334.1 FAD-dependent oxidoreductase [Albimonas sp. CAU 1670]
MAGTPQKVVIVGAGYTALWAVKSIRRRLRRRIRAGEVTVTVVAPKTYHSFHGWTAESVTGVIGSESRRSPLRRLLQGLDFRLARATAVDLDRRTVTIEYVEGGGTATLDYDHLLLANGAYDAAEKVPGLDRHGLSVKVEGGVDAVRGAILAALEQAQAAPPGPERDAWLGIVVAGGGFTGVELASNIAEMIRTLAPQFPVLAEAKPRMTLVHSGDALLPVLRPRFQGLVDYAVRQLAAYGIDVRLETRITEATEEGVVLSTGETLPARLVICTVGQKTVTFPGAEALPRNARGQLIADEHLRVRGHAGLWTGGDAAEVPFIKGGPCPMNALWAIKHGVWVGDNIARTIEGRPLRVFSYRGLGQAASLGIGKGMGELYGVPLKGWIGWTARFFFFLYFQPSRRQAARVLTDWILLGVSGRQTSFSRRLR